MTNEPTLDEQIAQAEADGNRLRASALKATRLQQLRAGASGEVIALALGNPEEAL
jgi:hypothetical protein